MNYSWIHSYIVSLVVAHVLLHYVWILVDQLIQANLEGVQWFLVDVRSMCSSSHTPFVCSFSSWTSVSWCLFWFPSPWRLVHTLMTDLNIACPLITSSNRDFLVLGSYAGRQQLSLNTFLSYWTHWSSNQPTDSSGAGRVFTIICLCSLARCLTNWCRKDHQIKQRNVPWWVLETHLFWGHRSRSQKQCWCGSLHCCKCWLLVPSASIYIPYQSHMYVLYVQTMSVFAVTKLAHSIPNSYLPQQFSAQQFSAPSVLYPNSSLPHRFSAPSVLYRVHVSGSLVLLFVLHQLLWLMLFSV